MERDAALAKSIAATFRHYVLGEYLPRIGRCVELLTAEEAWRKPSPHGNSVANLLLHLRGNVQQWIGCGIDGRTDDRDRDAEFAATAERTGARVADLLAALERTARDAAGVIDALSAEQLLATYRYQDRYDGDGVFGVLHVLEHFSGHAGQIYAWTKQLKGVDLKFYDL